MTDGTYATQSASAIFRVLGGWGNLVGPGSFMMRATIFGSSTAVLFGIIGGMGGALLYGTASLPFIFMSSLGFVLGASAPSSLETCVHFLAFIFSASSQDLENSLRTVHIWIWRRDASLYAKFTRKCDLFEDLVSQN